MNKIGIICASDTELAPFLNNFLPLSTIKKTMLTFYTGKINHINVVAVFSGVCKVNAAIATQILIDYFKVETVINYGTAGGIAKHVCLFDTIISQKLIYHDVSEDILTEFHPYLKKNFFQGDLNLIETVKKTQNNSSYPILFGTMVTGEQFIEDEKRNDIIQKFNPLCVDMESASIAHVCYVNQIPFLSIRTITDTAEHKGIRNFEKNCKKASYISCKIVMEVIQNIL